MTNNKYSRNDLFLKKMTEEKFSCPSCGTLVSKGDVYCRICGTNLTEFAETVPKTSLSGVEGLPEELYERKFSLPLRFYKLLTAPSKAMKDIALAPDYAGILAIIAAQFVLFSFAIAMVLQKIQISGPYSQTLSGMLSGVLVLAIFVGVILFVAKWAIKSLIVRYACESGSGWDFKIAASIAGYAYIADIIFGVLGICISWLLIPTFHLDTANLTAARQSLNDYQTQLNWLKLVYTLPMSLIGLLWKSYLGGLGAHFGTKEKCSLAKGIALFFALGLIGLVISFII